MTIYRKANAADEAELLDLANYVFSQTRCPHDFSKLLPKAYGKGQNFAQYHYVAEIDGRVRAQVALLPIDFRVCRDVHLKLGYVGTVSTHPSFRGQGLMEGCMALLLKDARERGFDLLALGGQRQLYKRFGFDTGGQWLRHTVSAANVRYALKDVNADGYAFRPLQTRDVDACLDICRAQTLCGERTKADFIDTLASWNAETFVIEHDGGVVGYLCANGDGIAELPLTDESALYAVLKAWLTHRGCRSVTLMTNPANTARADALSAICEAVSVTASDRVLVLDWARVIQALLLLKSARLAFEKGAAVLDIQNECRLRIEVAQSGVTVCETREPPDVMLDRTDAQRLLLSPVTPYTQMPSAFRNWFPLYFSIPTQDSF